MEAAYQEPSPEAELLLQREQNERKSLGATEHLSYVFANPNRFLNLLKWDTANLLANSGINKLLGYYLGIFDLDGVSGIFRRIIDKRGMLAGIAELRRSMPTLFYVTLVFSVLWVIVVVSALAGAVSLIFDRATPLSLRLVVVAYPLYIVGFTVLVVSEPRSGHRSSMEFLIALFCASAIRSLAQRWALISRAP